LKRGHSNEEHIFHNKMLKPVPILTQAELLSAIVSQPLVVTPDTTVMEAIAHMSGIRVMCSASRDASQLDELHVQVRSSCVSIVEDGQLLGILTERDIVRLSAEQRDLDNLAIRDVMTENVITLRAADFTDIFVAVNLLGQHRIRHLPVVDDFNCLVGLLTHESLQQTIRPVDLLRLRLVAEVMAEEVICATPDISILEIAQLMAVHRISSVIIVQLQMDDDQKPLQIPVGIVTERDLVQFQALNLNLKTCQAQAVMSTPIFTVNPSDSLWVVQQILEQRFIQRLAVTGDRGELLGIVTQSSLLQTLNPLELYNLAETLETKISNLEAEKIELLENRTIDLEHQVEERTKKLTAKIAHEQLIGTIATQIRSAGNLNRMLDTAVRELQSLLGCTRVSIWQFQPDGQTLEVVADWQEQSSPCLGQQVYDPCFSPEIYLNGKVHTIADIYTVKISPCHRDLLASLKIRAKILVPILAILDGSIPWGLISAVESDRPRDWESEEIALLQQIATQMAIAIQQTIAYEQVQNLNTELESRVAQRTAQLQEREAQLQDFFDNANDLIQSVSLIDGKFEYVNRLWRETLGYTAAEVDQLTIFDILHPDYHHHCQQLIQQLHSGTVTTIDRIELKLLTKTRQETIVEGSLNCRYVDGQAVATRGIFRDVSAAKHKEVIRKQAEIALSESQQFLQSVIETFPLAVFWKDRESHYLGCNHNFAQDANLSSPAEILGKTDYDLPWGAVEGDAYRADDRQVIDSGIAKLGIVETQTREDDTPIWLETNKLPLRNIDGEIIGVLGTYQDITDRKQTEAQLSRLSERLSLSLKSGAVGCWEWDILRDRLIWDDRMYELYGVKKLLDCEDYAVWLDTIHPDDRPATEAAIDLALAGDADFDTEFRVIHPDGSIHFIKAYGLLQQVSRDCSYSMIGINFDITAAKHAEAIRQQAEEAIALQLRQQQTLGAIAQQIRNSLQVEEILATATSQVKELMLVDRVSIFRVFPNGHLQAVEEVVSPEYPSLIERNWENEYLSKEEFEFYLDGSPNVVFDLRQDPRSVCLQAYVQEIQAKSKILVPILLLSGRSNTDLDVETWDEPHLWGLLSVHSCSSHRRWQDAEVKLLQQIADQLAIAIHQANLFEKLQQELTERQQAQTRLLESNEQLGISNQELARATRLKDEFLASMSHELRTPLNAILGMSESLQDEVFGSINDRQKKSIARIEKSGKHLLALINDILDLSKIAANKFSLELTDVSIQSLCQNSILFVKELAHKRQIRLKTQLPDDLKYLNIRVDDLRFRQVLINLLSNAVKFTPEGGSIVLDVRVGELGNINVGDELGLSRVVGRASACAGRQAIANAEVEMGKCGHIPLLDTADDQNSIDQHLLEQPLCQIAFSIIDTGIGIAPENMDKLFQSFVQIDSSLSRQYAGTGLGLSLVKRIVEMHGGNVSVQSEADRGSCFTVCLPFCPSTEMAISPSLSPLVYPLVIDADAETLVVKAPISILLVEDDEGNIETMTTYLESRGYQLIVANNGLQAISILEGCVKDLIQSQQPDIILMDIQMPGMDGFEATGHIRQIPEYATIPIIALTALAMPEDCQKCLEAGADLYVAKPVRLSQLVATIESLLKA
jgi:PAS domain S-box-containing protein